MVFQRVLTFKRSYGYTEEYNKDLEELISYYTRNYDYPVLMNVNIGHSDPIITFPHLVEVKLDSTKNKFYINEAGVV
ncbi:MAG: hypothetical protein LBE20_02720 [Deltaproteobacteria bacterium]|jgi:muramoyltetrapeptide carboxypeptidase LdcA involved in peptidoglycan recycling|nr:hypothetical protein [Deltaproteobacteria bacterium]